MSRRLVVVAMVAALTGGAAAAAVSVGPRVISSHRAAPAVSRVVLPPTVTMTMSRHTAPTRGQSTPGGSPAVLASVAGPAAAQAGPVAVAQGPESPSSPTPSRVGLPTAPHLPAVAGPLPPVVGQLGAVGVQYGFVVLTGLTQQGVLGLP